MIKAKEIYKLYQSDKRQCLTVLQEALDLGIRGQPGGIRPEEFSLRDLAAYFVMVDGEPIGHEGLRAWESGHLIEADVVSSTAFAAITQRVVNAAVREGFQLPAVQLSNLIPVVQARSRETQLPNFTLPLGDKSNLEYGEGQDVPMVGMMAEYVKALPPKKRGGRLPITREAIIFDETGRILDEARRLGEMIALEKERLIVRYITGLVPNCVIERRKTYSAELTADLFYSSGGNWTNQQTNPFADWTDIDDAENLILSNTLPGTTMPPMLTRRFLVAPPQMRSTVARVLNATEVRSGTSNVVASANPVADLNIQSIVSPLIYSEQVAAGLSGSVAGGTWFYGDLIQAFRYVQVWPLEVTESNNNDASLRRADILVEFQASEHGIPMVVEPRVWTKNLPS
jgi:hypothetical protein